eukprot:TRINITY_DN2865_c0_g1_i1.p1 TRINITY_DN2865_c0_g1~~TRINITY_DN2865_c0_g1_i1.p1  ORF type:complete len:281 (+),score=64.19 TRINITY_DN2865_c0_g1_i1:41-883(+)
MKFAQLVMGPAGVGKTSYTHTMKEHCQNSRRNIKLINLDPAAEYQPSAVDIDVRDLLSVDEVMNECKLGPNGALVYCMEYLSQNLDWLKDQLDEYDDDDYFIIDCPGQIELFSHLPVMSNFVSALQNWDFRVCGVYLIDCICAEDPAKLISASLMALSAMVKLEIPHCNIISKCDLVGDKYDEMIVPDGRRMSSELTLAMGPKWNKLNAAIGEVIDEYGLVGLIPLNIKKEESIDVVLSHIDNAIQYGDMLETQVPTHAQEDAETDMQEQIMRMAASGGY